MQKKLAPLVIGDIELKVPIIQGGMGVKVSTGKLAAAVSQSGGAGTIASVALGFGNRETDTDFLKSSTEGLQTELRLAKSITDKPVGVNILTALSNYDSLAATSVEEKADFIASGAGLPLKLPQYANSRDTKLLPIVSSDRAAELIIRTWKKRYDRMPDAIIVEGPMAGGHLGFSYEQLDAMGPGNSLLESLVKDVIKVTEANPLPDGRKIPVIAAGGIYDGADLARFLQIGAAGVQMATRFVATHECTVPDSFKQLYVKATDEDLAIIPSPVGMPGRVILTDFTRRMLNKERECFKCNYKCLKSCQQTKAPYCIANALLNAITDDVEHAVVFAGSNVSRIDRIMHVSELMEEIVSQAEEIMAKD